MNYDKEIIVTEIKPTGEQGNTVLIRVGDVLYIDTYEPKKNYVTPRFITRNGSYRPSLTFRECRTGIPEFAQLDRGVLVNVKEVEYITDRTYAVLFTLKIPLYPLKWQGRICLISGNY